MEIGKQFAHATVAKALLPGQFEASDKLKAFVSALATRVQDAEDALWDLYSMRWLWIAEGAQLDGIGDIVGQRRLTADDNEYRSHLYVKILTNVSKGEPERLIRVTNLATGASETHLIEKDFATVVIYAHLTTLMDHIFNRLHLVAPGGVLVAATGSETDPFVFGFDRDASGNPAGAELDYGEGWGETGAGNESIGGDFVELFHQH